MRELTITEQYEVCGGVFPIVVGGYVITKKAAALIGTAAAGGAALGAYNGYNSTRED